MGNQMTNWHARKNESLSSVPAWLKQAVSEYQQREGLQSWSAAALQLMVIAIQTQYSDGDIIRFGDKSFEDALWAEFDQRTEAGEDIRWLDFLCEKVLPERWGDEQRLAKHTE